MTTKQTNQTNQTGEQTLLLAGIPLDLAEAARGRLAEIGITFTPQPTDTAPLHQGAPPGHLPGLRPRRNHHHPERLPGSR